MQRAAETQAGSTPLGRPVVPLVYMMKAPWSPCSPDWTSSMSSGEAAAELELTPKLALRSGSALALSQSCGRCAKLCADGIAAAAVSSMTRTTSLHSKCSVRDNVLPCSYTGHAWCMQGRIHTQIHSLWQWSETALRTRAGWKRIVALQLRPPAKSRAGCAQRTSQERLG